MVPSKSVDYAGLCRTKNRSELDAIGFNPNALVGSSEKVNPMLNALIACEDYSAASELIKKYSDKLDPNQTDWEGKTALIIACKMYNGDEIVLLLLEKFKDKIEVNARDDDGRSALYYCVSYRKTKLVTALLEKGADPSFLDTTNSTPVDSLLPDEASIRSCLLSIDIEPDRDVMARGNALYWHFRFLRIESVYLDSTFNSFLDQPSNLDNLNHFKNYVNSENCTIQNKNKWVQTFEKPENQFKGTSIISECMGTQPDLVWQVFSQKFGEVQRQLSAVLQSPDADLWCASPQADIILSFLYPENIKNKIKIENLKANTSKNVNGVQFA